MSEQSSNIKPQTIKEPEILQSANPTGTILGGLTLSDIKSIIRDSNEPELRERFFTYALCLEEVYAQKHQRKTLKIVLSLPLDDASEEHWIRRMR